MPGRNATLPEPVNVGEVIEGNFRKEDIGATVKVLSSRFMSRDPERIRVRVGLEYNHKRYDQVVNCGAVPEPILRNGSQRRVYFIKLVQQAKEAAIKDIKKHLDSQFDLVQLEYRGGGRYYFSLETGAVDTE